MVKFIMLVAMKNYRNVILILSTLFFFGCSHLPWERPLTPVPGKAELTAQQIAEKKAHQQALYSNLLDQNVQILDIGDDFMLILQAGDIFYDHAPRIKWTAYPVLNTVTEYLQTFEKVSVFVAGYTDDEGSEQRNKSLSKARAQNVADYIWSGDIDTRLLSVMGYAAARPMAANDTEEGRARNQRIEITFRQLGQDG